MLMGKDGIIYVIGAIESEKRVFVSAFKILELPSVYYSRFSMISE